CTGGRKTAGGNGTSIFGIKTPEGIAYCAICTSARKSCHSGRLVDRLTFSMELISSLDSNGPRPGALKENRPTGGCPGLALAEWSVTKTFTSDRSAPE